MRKLIAYFIKYPVAVNVVMFGIVLFGIIGMLNMNSSFFPLLDSKIITVTIIYPGASPQEIEEGVVLKIEDNLKGLRGIDRVTSTSQENSGNITIETDKGEDIDVILSDVKNAVDRVPSFPTGMEPLVISKEERVRETIAFVVSGERVPLKTLKSIAQSVENDLRGIEGISQVEINGYPDEEIEISVKEKQLIAYQLTFQEVAEAISKENILVTGGNIKTDTEEYLIRANSRSYFSDELDNLIVRTNIDGNSIRLKDIAEVRDIFSETPNANYYNGNLSVNISISNTNDEDLISTADKVIAYTEEFNQKNSNIQLDVVYDSSITLNQRTVLLAKNAFFGILLVVFFLSLFLNVRLSFWVAAGFPVAFCGMFIFAAAFGVTINVLSLFGMIIVIGILVDDGIVIAENIYHHYEKGKPPIRAAIDGTLEVIPPVISAIITTLLAFSTFFFLEGNIGEYFAEVSTVVILTLVVSLIEAFIILPAHVAHSKALIAPKERVSKKSFVSSVFAQFRKINAFGDGVMVFLRDRFYAPTLRVFLGNKLFFLGLLISLFLLTTGAIQGGIVRVTLFPSIASDRVTINLKMPEGTSVSITDSIISQIERATWDVAKEYTAKQTGNAPVVENVIKRIGPGSANAQLLVNLLPGEERDFSSPEISNAIREKSGDFYGVESLTYGSGGNFGGSPVSVSLLGNNIKELKAAKAALKVELSKNPLLKDISDNDPAGIKEIDIDLKEKAYLLGLDVRQVMNQVRYGFFGYQAQRFQRGQDEVKVWVRFDKENRSSIANLDNMRIVTPIGERVPFAEIATYTIARGDVAINHFSGLREIQVTADMKNPNESATDILSDIQTRIMPELQSRFPTISTSYEGQNREASKIGRSASRAFPVILALIYATIAFTFRSYSQPLLLMLLIPISLIGVAWGHFLHGFPINILSLLGIIALIGIMVNDGLVLIGKFNNYLKSGMDFDEALISAGKSRFRAIFLTSLTTIAGLAPLIFEKSRQAQFLIPMAISIAYGIAIATLLTLLILPILLSISNNIKVGVKWLLTGRNVSKEEVERAIKELKSEHEDASH